MGDNHRVAVDVHRVAAAVLIREDRLLLCRRSPSRAWYPAVWDLPGGHIDPDEPAPAALVRELREELGIGIPEPSADCHDRVVAGDFDLQVWILTEWSGTPVNASPEEHDVVAWFSEVEALKLHLADENPPRLISDALCTSDRHRTA